MTLWPDGLAGISAKGLFSAIPRWVDSSRPAGETSQTQQLGLPKTAYTVATLGHMIWSPNLVWLVIAVLLHGFAPYEMGAARTGFAVDWLLRRFVLNYFVAFSYYAFFFVGLYVQRRSKRKFRPGSFPTFGNMAHNLWYWSLAIVQWTWWEAVMVRLWATGTVKYVTFEQIQADSSGYLLGLNLFWICAIPLWRDLHFYIAHRFLHIRAIYTYVHKLHHRNADPEPFSGMTMHPIEHLYYFSNAFTPSLYLSGLSPLIFTWNFIHLTIAPAAGHSGWEDHFQSDQYHYVHHAKFECNYGSPTSGCIDQYLGTFREKLGKSKAYTGEWSEADDDNLTALAALKKKNDLSVVWSPNGYLGLPESWDHTVYTTFWCCLFPLVWVVATKSTTTQVWVEAIPNFLEVGGFTISTATAAAATVAYFPVVLAVMLSKLSGDRTSWRWPFQKENIVGVFGLFLLLGWAACILPVYHATLWVAQLRA